MLHVEIRYFQIASSYGFKYYNADKATMKWRGIPNKVLIQYTLGSYRLIIFLTVTIYIPIMISQIPILAPLSTSWLLARIVNILGLDFFQ